MSELSSYIAKILFFHRKKAALSRNALAELAGVGKTAVYDLEHGKASVQIDTLSKILDVLNIKIEFKSPLMEKFREEKDATS